jgi:hypothetical protein
MHRVASCDDSSSITLPLESKYFMKITKGLSKSYRETLKHLGMLANNSTFCGLSKTIGI